MAQEQRDAYSKSKENINQKDNITEKPLSKDFLESKVNKYLNNLSEEKIVSKKDTEESLSLIDSLEKDLTIVLPSGHEEAENEINILGAKKESIITEAEFDLVNELNGLNFLDRDPGLDIISKKEYLKGERKTLELREMREIAIISYDKIKQHAASLGIIISDFNAEKIDFQIPNNFYSGSYSCDSDNIEITSKSAKVIIHEELHFAAAVDNRSGKKNLGNNRLTKSGFKSSWKEKDNEEESRDNLRSLNEAVTEKMAQEIFLNNKESINSELLRINPEIESLNNSLVNKEKDVALKEFELEAGKAYELSQEMSMEPEDSEAKSFEEFIQDKKQEIDSVFNLKMGGVKNEEILSYHASYKNEISILDAILDKLSQERVVTDQISFDAAKAIEWKAMQIAYLKGETMYLRKIEKNIGHNILREFNNINIGDVNKGKESLDVFKDKVQKLIERINS